MNTSRDECLAEIHRLLAERVGFDVESLGRRSITHAIGKRMARLGLESQWEFLGRLRLDATQFQELLEEIVVLETWFFRDPQAFDCLRTAAAEQRPVGGNVFRVLSVGCSTGEEPLSMAMTLREAGMEQAGFHVLGADLSDQALHIAREAVYASRSFREQGSPFRAMCDRWCERTGQVWRVQAEIRSAVEYRWGNLAHAGFLADETPFQVVFCRNVLIYHEPQARRMALDNLRRLTSPGGLVCCAPAEARIFSEAGFTSLGSLCPFAFRHGANRTASVTLASPARNDGPREPHPDRGLTESPKTQRLALPAAQPSPKVHDRLSPAVSDAQASGTGPVPGDESVPSLVQRARLAADLGELDQADSICAQVLARDPANAEVHYLSGVIRQSQGAMDAARQWFEKTLYLDPTHYHALVHLMLLAEQSGDLVQASNYRRRVERLAPVEMVP